MQVIMHCAIFAVILPLQLQTAAGNYWAIKKFAFFIYSNAYRFACYNYKLNFFCVAVYLSQFLLWATNLPGSRQKHLFNSLCAPLSSAWSSKIYRTASIPWTWSTLPTLFYKLTNRQKKFIEKGKEEKKFNVKVKVIRVHHVSINCCK